MVYGDIKARKAITKDEAGNHRAQDLETRAREAERRAREAEAALAAAQTQSPAIGGHVTVEKTAKKYKRAMLAAWGLIIFGMCVGVGSNSIGGVLVAVGIVWLVATKIAVWWNHG